MKKFNRLFKSSTLSTMTVAAMASASLSNSALAQRPNGLDVSSYQGAPNWSSVKGAGYSFAWAKATEGTYFIDGDFTYNQSNGKSAGLYMGAYHFCRPDLTSPGSEASYFWNEAGGYIKADGKTMQPVLDFETFNGAVGASSYSAWANAWCNAVKSDAAAAGVTTRPVLYTSACTACDFNSSVSAWYSWVANYNGESSQSGNPWNTCTSCEVWGPSSWTAWQYSSSGSVPGIGGTSVDLDVYNGSASSMASSLVIGGRSETLTPGPNAVSWGNNRIDIVCRGGGDAIYHKYWDGSAWQPNGYFENLGGISLSGAGVSSWGVNRLDTFCTGTDGSLQHRYFDGSSWNPTGNWENLGGSLTSTPTAVSWGVNRIDVVVRGGGNNIYHKYFDGTGWYPSGHFENLGGNAQGQPAIASWGSGRLDVFMQGSDNALWHVYFSNGSWSTWQSLGGSLTSGPAAVSWGNNRIDVVVRGGNNNVYHKYWDGTGWYPSGGFENLGGTATSDPGISSWGNGRLDVFCRGTDGSLQHKYFSNNTWSTWQSLGGNLQ